MQKIKMWQQSEQKPPQLIMPDELIRWVPGKILGDSSGLGWKDIAQRSYHYHGQDVEIPPMDSFMIVQYRSGKTPMDREFDGHWTRTECHPGHFSLLSREAQSHWHWTQDVVVSHLYLSNALLCRVARDLQEREVEQVCLHDVLQGQDKVVSHLADQAMAEAQTKGVGGGLYAEALSVQLAVHLLRSYASCVFKRNVRHGRLLQNGLKQLDAYIEAHMANAITIEGMAALFGMGAWTFNRHLRHSVGMSAYAYVIEKRLQRALRMLQVSELPIKAVACECGFSDQAHLTRAFHRRFGNTPGQCRAGFLVNPARLTKMAEERRVGFN